MTDQQDIPPPPVAPIPQAPEASRKLHCLDQAAQRLVWDATDLLEYGISIGFKTAAGQTIPDSVMQPIVLLGAMLDGCDQDSSSENSEHEIETDYRNTGRANRFLPDVEVSVSDWINFLAAFRQLADLLRPVTATTLRDTNTPAQESSLFSMIFGFGNSLSTASRFSRKLWLCALIFAVFNVSVEWGGRYYGAALDGAVGARPLPNDKLTWLPFANTLMQLAEILVPFFYGGLGACVYLLRSAHTFIAERSFDRNRKAEYYNRIVLGMISGGAIVLFIDNITNGGGQVIKLSSAALGFLAGYSTDFLFQTIERVIAAILPKVSVDSVRQAAAPARGALEIGTGDLSLKDLLDRHERATGDDKKLYATLLEKLRDRL